MKVKICGLTTPEDASMCEDLGADALGFVHLPGRSRSRELGEISRMCSSLKSSTLKVLVCRPRDIETALNMLSKSGTDALQLYSLGAFEMDSLREQGARVFRVVHPSEPRATIFAACSEALVFEDGTPGTGTTYDYSRVPARLRSRAFIAGGLSPDNVHIAKALNPYGVDVSSGVESTVGTKNRSKVEDFIRKCRL